MSDTEVKTEECLLVGGPNSGMRMIVHDGMHTVTFPKLRKAVTVDEYFKQERRFEVDEYHRQKLFVPQGHRSVFIHGSIDHDEIVNILIDGFQKP